MKNFQGKTVVITGAGSGIGRALALRFGEAGARLALNDWNDAALRETIAMVEQKGGTAWGKSFDVSKKEDVYRFAEDAATRFGQIDVVINNAGIALEQCMIERMDYPDFEKVIGINMWGMIYGSKAFLPYLKARPEAVLANVSSIFGVIGYPNQGPYVTAKFAVRGFTETLRIELAKSPVEVVCIHPGGIRTNIARNVQSDHPARVEKFAQVFEKMAITSAEDAAAQIVNGIRKKKKRIVIGSDARQIDWMARLFPSAYERLIFRKYDVEKFSI
ncbi:MAG: SDR family oxidoreductase [Haliscomenobacter sp.]|nr:SDR family oxidoreductase [Haliscomenobacter sp.]MBK8877058.1 SDR family oxidoreductase [Haliscomenobacter sp.]